MARKARSDSLSGGLKAMQDVSADPLRPPYPLGKKRAAIWDEILLRRARDEWRPVDLRFAFELADVMVRMREEENKLKKEGTVIAGDNGPKSNPRANIVQTLVRRAMWLGQYLRIHPASDYRDPSLVRGGRQAEAEARQAVAPVDPNQHLLPLH